MIALNIVDVVLSDEQEQSLRVYDALLHKWQKTLNLVGPSTVSDSWSRHILDSVQLCPLIPDGEINILDIGSGAGFPGLVIALMKPSAKVFCVESDQRKSTFLRTVSRETQAGAVVYDERIENVNLEFVPDVISARALASLKQLFEWCLKWAVQNPNLIMIFPKGEKAQAEIEEALQFFNFEVEAYSSKTSNEAHILCISKLSVK
jgi:16S rRNA (guanine527-N7)-methyltransferase